MESEMDSDPLIAQIWLFCNVQCSYGLISVNTLSSQIISMLLVKKNNCIEELSDSADLF